MSEFHRIDVAGGETVVAVSHDAGADRWLVFCHGLVSDKSGSYERRAERAVEAGWNAVRFDARGCGDADGDFAESTLDSRLADLAAVVDHFDLPSYACFGSSFGAKVALHAAASDERVTGVVGRAPVTYTRTVEPARAAVAASGRCEVGDGIHVDARFFDSLDRHPFEPTAAAIDVPVALVHGGADDVVAVEDSFEAAQELGGDVLLASLVDEGHLFSPGAEERLLELTFAWLDGV